MMSHDQMMDIEILRMNRIFDNNIKNYYYAEYIQLVINLFFACMCFIISLLFTRDFSDFSFVELILEYRLIYYQFMPF